MFKKFRRFRNNRRRGLVAVEVAMVAPFVFILVFGLMEWARAEMIRQATSTAAFNAARLGTVPGTTTTEVEDKAAAFLDVYFVSNATIVATITEDESTISVSVPMADNSWFLKQFFGNLTIHRDFTLRR